MTDRFAEGWRACREAAARIAAEWDCASRLGRITAQSIGRAIRALPDPPAPAAEPEARAEVARLREALAELRAAIMVDTLNDSDPSEALAQEHRNRLWAAVNAAGAALAPAAPEAAT